MSKLIIPHFNKGEISPELRARVDLASYQGGLATARNCIIHTYGGISKRPGTKFIAPVRNHFHTTPRLKRFQFKSSDTYILEFGNFYMRVIRNDGQVMDSNQTTTITNITQAQPPVVTTSAAHGYVSQQQVFIEDVVGMTEVNNKYFIVGDVTSTTFEIKDQINNGPPNGALFTAYSSGGTVYTPFELTTPWPLSVVFELGFTQSADQITIVHPDYTPRLLTRTDHDEWTLTQVRPGVVSTLGSVEVDATTTGSTTRRYAVTIVNSETGAESLTGQDKATTTITDISNTNPILITTSSHSFVQGDEIIIILDDNETGMNELDRRRFLVDTPTGNTFRIADLTNTLIDGSSFSAFDATGTSICRAMFTKITNSASASSEDNHIQWTDNTNIPLEKYNIYRDDGEGIFGLIGSTKNLEFQDSAATADFDTTPPVNRDPFFGAGNNPRATSFYQQRKVYGGSDNNPDTSEFSVIGDFSNFSRSIPARDDDAVTSTLTGLEVNEIRHYVPLKDLLVFTFGSEWFINEGFSDSFTPGTVNQTLQSRWGCSLIPPEILGSSVLFITPNNSDIRSMTLEVDPTGEVRGLTNFNLNRLARHLLEFNTVTDWTSQRYPDSSLYIVRDDGSGLYIAYDFEEQINAWSTFDTDGYFRSVESLPRNGVFNEDSIYYVVERRLPLYGTAPIKYIEVMRQTPYDDIRDCYFVDAGLSYDNPINITKVTQTNPVSITTEVAHGISDGDTVDIYDIIWEPDINSSGKETQPDQLNTRRYLAANVTTTTLTLQSEAGVDVDGTAFNAYDKNGTIRVAASTFTNLDHLEGKTVKVLADGSVISGKVVSDSTVTLSRKYSRVHIGLPYTSEIETLDINDNSSNLVGSNKRVNKVVFRLYKSRAPFVGPTSSDVTPMKIKELEAYADPIGLFTGDKEVILKPSWNSNGRVWLRQPDPVPLTVLSLVPHYEDDSGDR